MCRDTALPQCAGRFESHSFHNISVSCPAQGQRLGWELERDLVFVVSFHLSFSCVSLSSQKRAGYCGYCSSHFLYTFQMYAF